MHFLLQKGLRQRLQKCPQRPPRDPKYHGQGCPGALWAAALAGSTEEPEDGSGKAAKGSGELKGEGELALWALVSHLAETCLGSVHSARFRKLGLLFVAGLVTGPRSVSKQSWDLNLGLLDFKAYALSTSSSALHLLLCSFPVKVNSGCSSFPTHQHCLPCTGHYCASH